MELIRQTPVQLEKGLTSSEQTLSDIVGDLVEQWGFKRQLGSVWSLLYLRNAPLTAYQIQEVLGLSAGSVNALLNELLIWGVVRKLRIPNHRSTHYEVETQIWKCISNVLKGRELRILEEAISRLDQLQQDLKEDGRNPQAKFQVKQIRHISNTVNAAYSLAEILVKASPEKLAMATKVVSRLRSL